MEKTVVKGWVTRTRLVAKCLEEDGSIKAYVETRLVQQRKLYVDFCYADSVESMLAVMDEVLDHVGLETLFLEECHNIVISGVSSDDAEMFLLEYGYLDF